MKETREQYFGQEDEREATRDPQIEWERRKGHIEGDCTARVLSGKHVLVIGKTGTGKTYWAAAVADKWLKSFIFINPQFERAVSQICDFSTDNEDEVIEALEEGYRKIEFLPAENDIEAIDQLEVIRRDLWAAALEMKIKEGEWWIDVFIDEAHIYAWLGSRTDIQNFARRGRRWGVRCWFLTPQPQDLAKSIVNSVDWQVIFKLGQYSSIYFKNYHIPIEAHLSHLKKDHYYLVYDGDEIYRCLPI